MFKPLIIGHRCCKYPGVEENSVQAAERSVREGSDIIEIDAFYKDGSFMAYHPGIIKKNVKIGQVSKLENVLKTINNAKPVYVDVKQNLSEGKIDLLLEIISKNHGKKVIIGSFPKKVLKLFKEKRPDWLINMHCFATKKSIAEAVKIGSDWINPMPYFLNKSFINVAQKEGLKVVPAGAQIKENYNKLLEFIKKGVYAISTFKPGEFRTWLEQRL